MDYNPIATNQYKMSSETNATATANPIVKPESDKIIALKAAYKTAWKAMNAIDDPFTEAAKNAKLAVLKADGEIKAQQAAESKLENDAKIAEARNQRIALVTVMLDAYSVLLSLPKTATAEAKAAAQTNFDTAREIVTNELLAKYAANKPAKAASENGEQATGRNSEAKSAILEMFHAGKSHAEIEAAGYPRSTVWHVINKYKKANS